MRSTLLLLCTLFAVLGPAAAPTAAVAQSSPCARPAKPAVPAADADRQRMLEAGRQIDQYVADMEVYLKCLPREMENARVEADDIVAEWNRVVADFNARQQQ